MGPFSMKGEKMAVKLYAHCDEGDKINNLTLASAILDLINELEVEGLSGEVVSNMITYQIRHLELPARLKGEQQCH